MNIRLSLKIFSFILLLVKYGKKFCLKPTDKAVTNSGYERL